MNKITTLIAWPSKSPAGDPRGTPSVLSVVDIDGEDRQAQSKVFVDAKTNHRFPKGVIVLGFTNSETPGVEIASFISNETADLIAGQRRNQQKAEDVARDKANAAQKKRQSIAAAHGKLSAAAVAWGAKRDILSKAKQTVGDDEANLKHAQTDAFKAKLESSKKALVEAEKAEKTAQSDYEAAKEAKAALVNPPKK